MCWRTGHEDDTGIGRGNMTKKFDAMATRKIEYAFLPELYTYNGVPIREMRCSEVSKDFARKYIAAFHYSKTMPDSTQFCFAGYLEDRLCGIVCYGQGCGKNQYTSLFPDIKNGEYCELTRLWCVNDMPRNTESKLISMSLKMLPERIKVVLSFADESMGHCGIIYQATNWIYCGKNKGGKMLEDENGLKAHPRLIGIYKMRHPELKSWSAQQVMDLLKLHEVPGGSKYRYVYLRGDKRERERRRKEIADKILPYPKIASTVARYSEEEIIRHNSEVFGENKDDIQFELF